MDYQRLYNQLISKRLEYVLTEGYIEKHHIIPKCMGGTNDSDNLVKLTAREHFVAHQLLVKIYPDIKGLIYGLVRFGKHKTIKNSKIYEWIRIKNAKTLSLMLTGRVLSEEHRRKISIFHSRHMKLNMALMMR